MLDPAAIRLLEFCDYLVSEAQANNSTVLQLCQTLEGRLKLLQEFNIPAANPSDAGYIIANYDKGDVGIQAAVAHLVNIVGLQVVGAAYADQIAPPSTTPKFAYSSIFSFLARLLTYRPLLQELQQYAASGQTDQLEATLQAYQLTNGFGEYSAITTLVGPNAQNTSLTQNALNREAGLVTTMNQFTNSFQQQYKFF